MTIFVIKISGNGNEVIRDGLFAARNFNWFAVWFSDCFYATVGAFGLTLISDFLLEYQIIINIFGGGFILFMGIRLLIKKDKAVFLNKNTTGILKMFFSSFAVGITNPAAIFTFLFAFSYFGISAGSRLPQGIMLVSGVFIGTYIWWGTLTAVTNIIKKKTKKFSFRYINRIFGMVLCLFGAVLDRANPLFPADYAFRDIYFLSTAAEDEEGVDARAINGLNGWIECFPKAHLAGTVFAGGVNGVGEISGHPVLVQAYAMGKAV